MKRLRPSSGSRLSYISSTLKKPNACKMKFDDITYQADGGIYVFKGAWLFKLKNRLGVSDSG